MTVKTFSPWRLGAPLYMPANRKDIVGIANGDKLPNLRSMIFCTEDALSSRELNDSIGHLGESLEHFHSVPNRYRFIRARNPDTLSRLLDLEHISRIDGFILPKLTVDNFPAYFDQLRNTGFHVMPTLETPDVFDIQAMRELRQALLQPAIFPQILMLRIGGNDLMNLLGLRRPRKTTLYQTPMGNVIGQLVTVFKPYGFSLSAPVFEYLDDADTLLQEIKSDLTFGLTGKTAIHPGQIATIESAYAVDLEDYEMALTLSDATAPAVFKMHNAMCEPATHAQWSRTILDRHACFGVRSSLCSQPECQEIF